MSRKAMNEAELAGAQAGKRKIVIQKDFNDHTGLAADVSDYFSTGPTWCDVILVIQDAKFYSCKGILAAVSPYFRRMFSSCVEKPVKREIELEGFTKEGFKPVWEYIHGTKVELEGRDGVLAALQDAHLLGLNRLCDKMGKALAVKDPDVSGSPRCLNLCMDATNYHFPELRHTVLKEKYRHRGFLSSKIWCLGQKNDEWKVYGIDRNDFSKNEVTLYPHKADGQFMRAFVGIDKKLYLMGGGDMRVFDLGNHEWFEGPKPPEHIRWPATAVAPKSMFVCGYFNLQNMPQEWVFQFDVGSGSWVRLKDMRYARYGAGACYQDSCLHVLGGYSQNRSNKYERLDLRASTWEELADLPRGTGLPAVACYEGDVIYSGGDGQKKVYCYDVRQNKWQEWPHMVEGRQWHGLIPLDGNIYAIGGMQNPSIEVFKGKQWEVDLLVGGGTFHRQAMPIQNLRHTLVSSSPNATQHLHFILGRRIALCQSGVPLFRLSESPHRLLFGCMHSNYPQGIIGNVIPVADKDSAIDPTQTSCWSPNPLIKVKGCQSQQFHSLKHITLKSRITHFLPVLATVRMSGNTTHDLSCRIPLLLAPELSSVTGMRYAEHFKKGMKSYREQFHITSTEFFQCSMKRSHSKCLPVITSEREEVVPWSTAKQSCQFVNASTSISLFKGECIIFWVQKRHTAARRACSYLLEKRMHCNRSGSTMTTSAQNIQRIDALQAPTVTPQEVRITGLVATGAIPQRITTYHSASRASSPLLQFPLASKTPS
ncbi:unnamed protein product [Darwinula stevensoni]|uniref:BTB domain-containing protein n=1 Tax=Darwinula stevensoni TaxID=69355 RepID=A0A7R8X451_9CRUS|nr:unnamed protein product [Darwinula stevensoni]CAG0878675.1 unnamed protein product [Darwinula stevensoni]